MLVSCPGVRLPGSSPITERPEAQTPWGAARTACRPLLLVPVPWFPELVLQPPWVWMPTAKPVCSQITGEPEFPPVVSVWYSISEPPAERRGPKWVCCT